jgi:hypothetical protein
MSQPRQKPFSPRDREIYHAVRICHRKQTAVALQFGLTQARISQIVRKVGKFMSEFLPGEDLDVRLGEMAVPQLVDWECYLRRQEHYRHAALAFEQSQHNLITKRSTFAGSENDKPEQTVVTEREQRISLDAVKVMERINDKIERTAGTGRGVGGRGPCRAGTAGPLLPKGASSGTPGKLAPPECLSPEDRERWPKLMREEQELAAGRLELYPKITLDHARAPAGPLWSYYPWRTEAESSSAMLASLVVEGEFTIEDYLSTLELTELSKPFAHPNVLTKDRSGRWQLLDPKQVPLPVLSPERAALPEGSPERVYWPYQSKAEHFAMMRAEMVLRGHLSRDQYESLNAWASWYMNEKYPDPLARIDGNISAGASRESAVVREGEVIREGEALVAQKRAEPAAGSSGFGVQGSERSTEY